VNPVSRGALSLGAVAAIALASVCGICPDARADVASPAEAQPAPRRVVRLVIAGDDNEAAGALEASLRELLARLDLTVETSRAERLDLDAPALADGSSGDLATAWVDMRAAHATTAIVDGKTGRVVARRSVARDRSTAIVVEELAHIIHASVEELADQDRRPPPATPKTSPPEPPPPEPPRVASEEARWGLDGGGFFAGRAFGNGAEAVIGGGGLAGAALGRAGFRPALWLIGTYHVAFDVRGRSVDVHTRAATMRLAPTIRLFGGDRWLVEAGPEGGFDVMWTAPRPNATGLPRNGRIGDESTDVSPIVGAIIAAHLSVGPSADLLLAFSADIDLSPHRFVVAEGTEIEPLFVPWRVRPAILVGFTFNLAGSVPYASRGTLQ